MTAFLARLQAAWLIAAALNNSPSLANNIQVSNLALIGNTGSNVQIQFDLSWENSWRGGGVSNWDAAWVFVKYRQAGAGTWHHARLGNGGHLASIGSTITSGLLTPGAAHNLSTNPVLGVFVHRSGPGDGDVDYTGTQLNWAYGAYGLGYNDIAEVQVFAIEMVYVTQGDFAAGSGGAETNAFTLTTINTATATTAPSGAGFLGGQAGGYPTGATAPSTASWPNGYRAFYCMKYELSQQAYVDFLNTLTYDQQATRTAASPDAASGTYALYGSHRNGIAIEVPGVAGSSPARYACDLNGNNTFGEADDGRDVACNFIAFPDVTAYLDWSGLRPMTELEFEKACRGTIAPIANEFPWGTTTASGAGYGLSDPGSASEGIATNYSTVAGNANYTHTFPTASTGPFRNGIFAANPASTGRISAGASYYGIMELGGNLYERAVPLGSTAGGMYSGLHGNGGVNAIGDADSPAWPNSVAVRGGAWSSHQLRMQVSDREVLASFEDRSWSVGGRGVRTAP